MKLYKCSCTKLKQKVYYVPLYEQIENSQVYSWKNPYIIKNPYWINLLVFYFYQVICLQHSMSPTMCHQSIYVPR